MIARNEVLCDPRHFLIGIDKLVNLTLVECDELLTELVEWFEDAEACLGRDLEIDESMLSGEVLAVLGRHVGEFGEIVLVANEDASERVPGILGDLVQSR
jgi:hypothetical protein